MKPKKRMKKLRITEADYMLAQRRAARLEEIAAHGKPVSMRSAIHKSKKIYNRIRNTSLKYETVLRTTSSLRRLTMWFSPSIRVSSAFSP